MDDSDENETKTKKKVEQEKSDSENESDKESSEEDDYMVKVDKKEVSESEESEEEEVKKDLKVNPKKLKKITKEGPYGGKNRQLLDVDGKALNEEDTLEENKRLMKKTLQIIDEAEARKQTKEAKAKGHETYLERV